MKMLISLSDTCALAYNARSKQMYKIGDMLGDYENPVDPEVRDNLEKLFEVQDDLSKLEIEEMLREKRKELEEEKEKRKKKVKGKDKDKDEGDSTEDGKEDGEEPESSEDTDSDDPNAPVVME